MAWRQHTGLLRNRCFSTRGRYPPQSRHSQRKDNGKDWSKAKAMHDALPNIRGEGLFGLHSVLQALESGHRSPHKLYFRERTAASGGSKRSKQDRAVVMLDRIKEIAAADKLPIGYLSKWSLNHLTDNKPHQGVLLDASPIKLSTFQPAAPVVGDTRLTGMTRPPVLLALDEIYDPQNLGAILRSAHFFGCDGVILSEQDSAPLTPTTSRTSVGALEVMAANGSLQLTRDLHESLAICRDLGWRILGAASGANATPSNQLSTDKPTILVMGNEHRGLRKAVLQCCDEVVTIPRGPELEEGSRVDSLNVSVASAVLLHTLLLQ